MANVSKTKKVLVSTIFGPAYRYVKASSVKEKYGRVGVRKDEAIIAKKRYVEYSKGQVQRRAIAAKDLEEKYIKQYVPGSGYIWVKQEQPAVPLQKPPEKKPEIRQAPDIFTTTAQDDLREVQEIESQEQKARSQDDIRRAVIGADAASRIAASRPADVMDDRDIGKAKAEGISTIQRGPVISSSIIPSAIEQAQVEERIKRQEAERPTERLYLPDEERIAVTAVYKTQGVPVYDEQGNQMYDEKGEPLKVMTKFTKPSDIPLLYDPIMTSGGAQQIDEQGRPLYRRKAAIVSKPVSEPVRREGSRMVKPIPGKDIQRIITGTFTDEDGIRFPNMIGHSSTINGRDRRVRRGESSYGGSESEESKDMEAIASLKRKLWDQGVNYETMDKLIVEALERGELQLRYHEIGY